jgi:hypothetical protein
MRMMARVQVDTATGSAALKSGALAETIGKFMEQAKPESAYFTLDQGDRCAFFVFDMKESSAMPALLEDAFHRLNAKIDLRPVMNLDELRTGLAAMPQR